MNPQQNFGVPPGYEQMYSQYYAQAFAQQQMQANYPGFPPMAFNQGPSGWGGAQNTSILPGAMNESVGWGLNLTMDSSVMITETSGIPCRICASLMPGSAPRLYASPEHQASHAAKHASAAMPQPLPLCFPPPDPAGSDTDEEEEPDEADLESQPETSTPVKRPRLSLEQPPFFPEHTTPVATPPQPPPAVMPPPAPRPAPPPVASNSSASFNESSFAVPRRPAVTLKPPSFLSESFSVDQIQAGDDKSPSNVLSLFIGRMATLGRLQDSSCQFPGCGSMSQSKVNVWQHVVTHARRALVECAACGYRTKAKASIWHHWRPAHGSAKPEMVDLRTRDPELETYVEELVYECYPALTDADIMLPAAPSRFSGAIKSLQPEADGMIGCRRCLQRVQSASLPLQLHLFGHFSSALFDCDMCRWEGQDPVAHSITAHGTLMKKVGDGLLWEDRRAANETQLLRLLQECFPGARVPAAAATHVVPREVVWSGQRSTVLNESVAASEASVLDSTMGANSSMALGGTPLPKRLFAYTAVFRAGWKLGLYKLDGCMFPGCDLKMTPTRQYTILDHITKHIKKPTDECGLCGFRSRGSIHSHFRQQHKDTLRIQMVDIRHLIEDDLLRALHSCYPGLGSAALFARCTKPGEQLPEKWLAQVDALVASGDKLDCAFEGCGANLGGSFGLALEAHILGHLGKPVFSCLNCRYEGGDIFSHGTNTHMRRGSTTGSIFKYEDERLGVEEELLALATTCFPDATGLPPGAVANIAAAAAAPIKERTWNSRRVEATDEKRPHGYLWIMRILFGWRSVTKEGLKCALCPFVLPVGARPDAHTYCHLRANFYVCRICGAKFKHRSKEIAESHGTDEEHMASPLAGHFEMFEDERWRFDAQLIDMSRSCFPVLDSLRTWYEEMADSAFCRHLEQLRGASAEKLDCAFDGCSFSLARNPKSKSFSVVLLHDHVLSHCQVPMFRCHSCRFEGQDIWGHIKTKHGTYSRRNAGLPFEDERGSNEQKLRDLAIECFPSES